LTVIGERINPTGKKKLQKALLDRNYAEVRKLATEQIAAGAQLLDVNAGMGGIDETETLLEIVRTLSATVDTPLVLDSSSPEALAAALREYPGRAMVNSVSAEQKKLREILPIAARYGAAILVLPLDDTGVPETADERARRVEEIARHAEALGCRHCDLVVDGLVMTVSSSPAAAQSALATVGWASHEFGVNTVLGLSNVSFGLPERRWLNATFLAMAVARGLTMVIANPCEATFAAVRRACDALQAGDPNCLAYIEFFSRPAEEAAAPASPADACRQAVIRGDRDGIADLVRQALDAGSRPYTLVEEHLVPAIMEVGERFERKEYFLPQLMLSAEAMQRAFDVLEPLLAETGRAKAGKIVIATVQGDVHDIGKNIVALMLRNYGFDVIDLGKDVRCEEIIQRAREAGADIIGLSALMTTTMTEMGKVIQQAREERLGVKFMVGGAVVTDDYARQIGADVYARDAVAAAKAARELVVHKKDRPNTKGVSG
jgi:5-methyltetrahydrofolate--homocysteine methyltransferase